MTDRRLARAAFGLAITAASVARAADPVPGASFPAPSARGTPAPARQFRYALRRCLELAARNHPKIHEARARLGQKQAMVFVARTAPFSEFTFTSGVGLAPSVFGSSVFSPNTDVALSSNMGLAWQVGLEGVVPLFTFGKMGAAVDAAKANVDVGRQDIVKERHAVELDVRRAFYGLQLARDARALLVEARDRIDRYVGRAERKVADGDGDDIELLKLKVYREEIESRLSETERGERVSLAGLRFLTGVEGSFDIPDEPLRAAPHRLGPLARYLAAARIYRPEVNMARAGVAARRAQLDLERARYYPDIGLALTGRYARAPEVTDQLDPFVKDNANFFTYGFALALRYKLDFLPQSARVAAAEAQLEEMRATERFALGGVGYEVEQAFEDARDAARRLDSLTRAATYAKQWLIKVQQGIDVGTMEEDELLAPAKEYALKRYAAMGATYDYNLALAKLALATGWEAIDV